MHTRTLRTWALVVAAIWGVVVVAVCAYLPLGTSAFGETPSSPNGPPASQTAPTTQPEPFTEKQAVEALVAEMSARCPASWDRPMVVETGTVQPYGYPKGKGWHIRTKRTALDDSGKGVESRLDVWVMTNEYGQVGPFDLGKKLLTPETTASECTAWPLGRAFFRGMGGKDDWPTWGSDIADALATSTPEGKLCRQRVDRAQKLLAEKGLPCHLNLYSRFTGPYIDSDWSTANVHLNYEIFPFPLDAAGRKIIIDHAVNGDDPMKGLAEVLAAGDEYVLLGDAGMTRPQGRQAYEAIVKMLKLSPVGEKVIASAKARNAKDRINSSYLVVRKYDDTGQARSSLVLSTRPVRPAEGLVAVVSRQQALDIVDRLDKDGFFSRCVAGCGYVPKPNVSQVDMEWFSANDGVVRSEWRLRMGWDLNTWSGLQSLRSVLEGTAAGEMDKFLAGFGDLPKTWQKEHDAVAAVAADVRAAVDAAVEDRWPQMAWVMRPPPTAEVYRGVAAEFQADPTLKGTYHGLSQGRPASVKAIPELLRVKAAWCLTSALCIEDMEVARLAALALAELKDARPAGFVLQVARAYAAILSFRVRRSLEIDVSPEAMQYALATALDAMLGTKVEIKTSGEDGRKWISDPAGFANALVVWQRALDQRNRQVGPAATQPTSAPIPAN